MSDNTRSASKSIYLFFTLFSAALIAAACLTGPIDALIPGLISICTSSVALTADSCALGGLNGALLNAGLLGLIAIAILKAGRVEASGTSIGAFFMTIGFSFFGKNCLNIWPIALGVLLYAKVRHESFGKYAHFSLFGAALGPVVSEMLFNRQLTIPAPLNLLLALAVGALIGFVIPSVSAHAATMHKGHNLFNVGLSAGLIGIAFFTVYKTTVLAPLGLDVEYKLNGILCGGHPQFFPLFLGGIYVLCLAVGIARGGISRYGKLLARTGYGCDFTKTDGMGAVLMNFGLLGLLALGYFLAIGAPFTGPTIGGILCITCWAGNGSHPRNVLPIFLGYVLVSFAAGWSLNAQGICVGICFATGLSPIAGRWGFGWGVLAGALHACMVSYTAAFHGGFDIYNGGFTSGLVAMILVPVMEALCQDIPTRQAAKKQPVEV